MMMPFWLSRSTYSCARISSSGGRGRPALALHHLLHHDGDRVRQFVADALERRLANELRHHDVLGLVRQLALGVQHGADGRWPTNTSANTST